MNNLVEALKNRISKLRVNHKIGSRDIANKEILDIADFLERWVVEDLERLETVEQENQEFREYFDKIASGNTIIELFREKYNLEKAMEIIDKKDIRVSNFKKVIQDTSPEEEKYMIECFDLTKEEYKLLKEVLCNE